MNRRNVLIGLGGVVAGGGALIGTGAFTTVEAERTLTVETAGDADAFLGLQIRDDLAGGGDEISLDFSNAGNNGDADGFNLNARTVLDKVLLVQNNGTQNGLPVEFSFNIDDGDESTEIQADEVFGFDENNDGEFDNGNGGISLDGAPLDAGQTTAYDLELELRESVLEDEANEDTATWAADFVDDDSNSSFEVDVTITVGEDSEE